MTSWVESARVLRPRSLKVALLTPGCPSYDRAGSLGALEGKGRSVLGEVALDLELECVVYPDCSEHPGFQGAGLLASTGDTSVSLFLLEQLSQI